MGKDLWLAGGGLGCTDEWVARPRWIDTIIDRALGPAARENPGADCVTCLPLWTSAFGCRTVGICLAMFLVLLLNLLPNTVAVFPAATAEFAFSRPHSVAACGNAPPIASRTNRVTDKIWAVISKAACEHIPPLRRCTQTVISKMRSPKPRVNTTKVAGCTYNF